jgi:phytoene synthase
MSDYSLISSVRKCRDLVRLSHSSFVPAFSLFPAAKREAMEILYAYTRFTDDMVDQPDIDSQTGMKIPISPRRKLQKLNQWVSALEAVFGSNTGNLPTIADAHNETAFQKLEQNFSGCTGLELLPALKMIVDKFKIPREALFHLIDGVESDITPRTFETFDDCADYCHQVATSVGFALLAVWGTTEPLFSEPVVRAAKACGIAFQWTNILRDLKEDITNGRFYLPQNELKRYGLTEKQFASLLDRKGWNEQKKKPQNLAEPNLYAYNEMLHRMEEFEEKFSRLLQSQFERCEIYYTNATTLYPLIQRDSRSGFGMMWSRYYALFRNIRRNPLRLGQCRIQLSRLQKIRLILRWKFLPRRQLK